MALASFFRLTTFFHWMALGGQDWKHSVEAQTLVDGDTDPGDAALETFADAMVDFYRELCVPSVFIEKVVISTWMKDTDADADTEPGYQAAEATTLYYSVYGQRSIGSLVPAPLDVCLDIRKSVGIGNPGRMPLRGVIVSSDVTTNAQGRRGLVPGSSLQPTGSDWLAAIAHIVSYLKGGSSTLKLAMLAGKESPTSPNLPAYFRDVTAITPVGVTTIQLEKHR